jgi:hypothetical protein
MHLANPAQIRTVQHNLTSPSAHPDTPYDSTGHDTSDRLRNTGMSGVWCQTIRKRGSNLDSKISRGKTKGSRSHHHSKDREQYGRRRWLPFAARVGRVRRWCGEGEDESGMGVIGCFRLTATLANCLACCGERWYIILSSVVAAISKVPQSPPYVLRRCQVRYLDKHRYQLYVKYTYDTRSHKDNPVDHSAQDVSRLLAPTRSTADASSPRPGKKKCQAQIVISSPSLPAAKQTITSPALHPSDDTPRSPGGTLITKDLPATEASEVTMKCPHPAVRIVGDCSFCGKSFCGNHRLPEHHTW